MPGYSGYSTFSFYESGTGFGVPFINYGVGGADNRGDRKSSDKGRSQCVRRPEERALGQWMAGTGKNAVKAGGIVTSFGIIDPPAAAAGVIVGVGGLFMIGGGMYLMEDAGDYRGAFQAGASTIISEGESQAGGQPDITPYASSDPADDTAGQLTNQLAGPDGC